MLQRTVLIAFNRHVPEVAMTARTIAVPERPGCTETTPPP
jgi:hypothetical protein